MSEAEIPSGFIERDLRDSQYIAKKAKEILNEVNIPVSIGVSSTKTLAKLASDKAKYKTKERNDLRWQNAQYVKKHKVGEIN